MTQRVEQRTAGHGTTAPPRSLTCSWRRCG